MENFILVPTDFSDNAWVALQYAANLAADTKMQLKIIHVCNQAENVASDQMSALISQFNDQFPSLNFNGSYLKGSLNESINQLLRDESYKLIVMGTKGASRLKSVFLGSNTMNIINQSSIPVIAIPENANYILNKIGLLSNYKNIEIDVMKKAIDVLPDSFTLTLLHVREDENEDEEVILDAWKEVMKDKTNLKKVECRIGIGSGVNSIVNTMIKEEKIDLLIATNNGKSFFRTLFNRNLIKTIAMRPQAPVLFIKA